MIGYGYVIMVFHGIFSIIVGLDVWFLCRSEKMTLSFTKLLQSGILMNLFPHYGSR